jgi:predicted AlkP superfamily pyrophosphatase or phosphodiesterase
MAGHIGKAYWYSTTDGSFASSTYYYDEFPEWVEDWNAQKKADEYYGTHWELSNELDTYHYGANDDRPFENPADLGFGRVFPHPYGDKDNKYYYTLLMASPVADELTVDFAKELIRNEQLGQDDVPDYLGVSLSSTDYVGHTFGPASLETEENLLRLDRTLADLFAFVDESVGLDNTLIVLSADHGSPEAPEYMSEKGFSAGRLNLDTLDYSELDKELKERFGIGKEVIKTTFHPYVYFDHALLQEKNVDIGEISAVVARALIEIDGIAYAIPSTDLVLGKFPDAAPIARQVLRNFSPKRSGDIYIIYEPHWVPMGTGDVAIVNHGSPWRYDSFVPVVFAGHGLKGQRVSRPVETVDVAATLAAYMNIKPPSGSVGIPLFEVLAQ